MKVRDSILAKIKKDLRGKKNTWHMVEFNYFGYNVRAKMHGCHAQRIEARSTLGGWVQSMPYSVRTIKAAVQEFSEVIDHIEANLEAYWKEGKLEGKGLRDYILHFDPLNVLSCDDGELIANGVGMNNKEYRESIGLA